jgi:hypothetical protein
MLSTNVPKYKGVKRSIHLSKNIGLVNNQDLLEADPKLVYKKVLKSISKEQWQNYR